MSTDPASVLEAVDNKLKKVRTRSLDVSFNEIYEMFKSKELKIDPEYQRLFRWSKQKQSRFIESVLLEMPIPPIYVVELADSRYELIDGLQRVTSYLHFRGLLPDFVSEANGFADGSREGEPEVEVEAEHENVGQSADGGEVDSSAAAGAADAVALRLDGCDIITELNGLTFGELPVPLQIRMKRNFLRMEVLRVENDPRLRYYMFKRLNTGGERLSEQEVRNCVMRLLGPRYNAFLIEMSRVPEFRKAVSGLSREKIRQKADQEYVLRFFALKNDRASYERKVGEFLSGFMERMSDPDDSPFDYDEERRVFLKTFKLLFGALGEDVFAKVRPDGRKVAPFSSLLFESITIGLQGHLGSLNEDSAEDAKKLKGALEAIRKDEAFYKLTTGGGQNYASALEKRISFVADGLSERLGA
ncbi:MAG: DUF262 domain-containing protein [Planctomycetes bacterium]|nr:DUF262 domain-containing protein [Planctomycetota bacterium]